MLNTLREQMDDEQKEAFDALSDAEKKEVLEEAKKQLNSMSEGEMREAMQGGQASGGGVLSKFRLIQNMSFRDFMSRYGEQSYIGPLLFWLLLKMSRTKVGCGLLIAIIVIVMMVIANM